MAVVQRTRIKICGVTRPEDAASAGRHGADAIGIVFHPPSPRNVPFARAMEIMSAISPFVTPVGVFVNTSAQEILDLVAPLGIHTVQLNGDESPETIADLQGLRVIKAIRVTPGGLKVQLDRWRTIIKEPELAHIIGFVMETGGTNQPGGTGVANNWQEVRDAQTSGAFEGLPPLIAAGGLKPETVADVIREVRPFAVDVSSGVESQLGIKSDAMIRDFIQTVRTADGNS